MPNSERLLIENPKPFIAANVPINDRFQVEGLGTLANLITDEV